MRERSYAKGLSVSFLEFDRYEDEGEDLEQSLLVIKNKYKKKLVEGLLEVIVCVYFSLSGFMFNFFFIFIIILFVIRRRMVRFKI